MQCGRRNNALVPLLTMVHQIRSSDFTHFCNVNTEILLKLHPFSIYLSCRENRAVQLVWEELEAYWAVCMLVGENVLLSKICLLSSNSKRNRAASFPSCPVRMISSASTTTSGGNLEWADVIGALGWNTNKFPTITILLPRQALISSCMWLGTWLQLAYIFSQQ